MSLPPRQGWLFQLGCWVALGVGVVQLTAHLAGAPAVVPVADGHPPLAPPYVFEVPGLRHPTFESVVAGLSLSLALLTATIGAAGLAVLRHGGQSAPLIRGVSRVLAIGSAVLLAVSIGDYFSAVTFLIAVMAMCFALAAVTETGE